MRSFFNNPKQGAEHLIQKINYLISLISKKTLTKELFEEHVDVLLALCTDTPEQLFRDQERNVIEHLHELRKNFSDSDKALNLLSSLREVLLKFLEKKK